MFGIHDWLERQARRVVGLERPRRRVLILTHHKCASSFVRDYVKAFCSDNRLEVFHSHLGTAKPGVREHVSLLSNAVYGELKDDMLPRSIHIIRNPLDIVVSAYYSHRYTHAADGWPELRRQRRRLDRADIEEGLFLTAEFLQQAEFYRGTPGPLNALKTWRFDDPRIMTMRMEDLVSDVSSRLGTVLAEGFGNKAILPDRRQFTFETMSGGRSVGQIDNTSHYRAGRAGMWRVELPRPLVRQLRSTFADLLRWQYPECLE